VATKVEAVPAIDAELSQARLLADRGQLGEALRCCQAHLAAHGPSADCFSLMGVVHQARQEEGEAVRCLLNALYLQPEHPEALLHLMLLRRQQGRDHEADLLRRRLERIDSRGEL
jgi:chemotaxis protein methyltransferase WspC